MRAHVSRRSLSFTMAATRYCSAGPCARWSRPGRRPRRRGRAAAPVPSVSKRPNGGGLATIRMGAPDNNMWFGWRVAVPTAALRGMTFSDALAQSRCHARSRASRRRARRSPASKCRSRSISASRPTSAPPSSTACARSPSRSRRIASTTIGADAAMRRRVFEFAKSINVPLIITSADAANLAEIDKLAEEFEINVALESKGDPKTVMAALEGRGKRMGVSAHLGGWAQAGIKAVDGLAIVKGKLLHVTAADRSALERARRASCRSATAPRALGDFFLAAYRAGHQAAVDYRRVDRHDRSRHGEEPAGVRARDVAGDVGARQRHAEDAGRPDSRRRSARRRDARADRCGDSAAGRRRSRRVRASCSSPTSRCIRATARFRTATT